MVTALWFSKPVRSGKAGPHPAAGHRAAAGPPASPTARGPVPLRVVTSSNPRPSWGRSSAVGEGVAEQLVPGAHPEYHRAVIDRPAECAVLPQGLGRPHLRPVLPTADAVEVGGRAVALPNGPGRARRRCPARWPGGPAPARCPRPRRCRAGRGRRRRRTAAAPNRGVTADSAGRRRRCSCRSRRWPLRARVTGHRRGQDGNGPVDGGRGDPAPPR